jgi:hypothetical protein
MLRAVPGDPTGTVSTSSRSAAATATARLVTFPAVLASATDKVARVPCPVPPSFRVTVQLVPAPGDRLSFANIDFTVQTSADCCGLPSASVVPHDEDPPIGIAKFVTDVLAAFARELNQQASPLVCGMTEKDPRILVDAGVAAPTTRTATWSPAEKVG